MPSSTSPRTPLTDGAAYDVIIVGARAAGAATALLLARHGLRTLVIDRAAAGSDTLSTHALMRTGVLQLSRWGLLDGIVSAGTPAVRTNTFHYTDGRVPVAVKPSPGVDALYAPRRTVLDPLLVGAARDAGAEVHHQTSLIGLVSTGGRVTGVRAATGDGRDVRLNARLVVGADGVRSTVARRVAAPVTRRASHTSAATYGYWSDLDVDGYHWVFRPGACSGAIPTNDGQVCLFASAPRARIGRGGTRVITDMFSFGAPELADAVRAAVPPAGTRSWPGVPGYLRRAHGPGWALVGDAGYFKDPLSAHGLSDALRDAELLARAVISGLDVSDGLDRSLADYEATRDRLSIPLLDVTDRIASHEWDSQEILPLLLELSAAMNDELELLGSLDAVAPH